MALCERLKRQYQSKTLELILLKYIHYTHIVLELHGHHFNWCPPPIRVYDPTPLRQPRHLRFS